MSGFHSEPYTPGMIAHALREMAPERLAAIHPHDFQRYPTRKIVPGKLIRELIDNERARRR
ncbi:MAG: hypothetical protein J7500_15665 [Sphingomonas sp.]|uniref:hypothetical protein n=1 Tax=Sphingomonas sp. TaxID=28214 RepID=UPI001B08CC25|nr:hypothetical protein [Sphingomonas sp.]MBO9624145.1 hypothetical protein [Sphingomonas sp.]